MRPWWTTRKSFGLWAEWPDAAVVLRQSKSFAIRRHDDSHDFLRNVMVILIHVVRTPGTCPHIDSGQNARDLVP